MYLVKHLRIETKRNVSSHYVFVHAANPRLLTCLSHGAYSLGRRSTFLEGFLSFLNTITLSFACIHFFTEYNKILCPFLRNIISGFFRIHFFQSFVPFVSHISLQSRFYPSLVPHSFQSQFLATSWKSILFPVTIFLKQIFLSFACTKFFKTQLIFHWIL